MSLIFQENGTLPTLSMSLTFMNTFLKKMAVSPLLQQAWGQALFKKGRSNAGPSFQSIYKHTHTYVIKVQPIRNICFMHYPLR